MFYLANKDGNLVSVKCKKSSSMWLLPQRVVEGFGDVSRWYDVPVVFFKSSYAAGLYIQDVNFNCNVVGDIFRVKFVAYDESFATIGEEKLKKIFNFRMKNFRMRVADAVEDVPSGDTEIFLSDGWHRFELYKTHARDLFSENDCRVSSVLKGDKVYVVMKSKNKEMKVRDNNFGVNFWNGTMPKNVFCDWLKEQDFYNKFQEIN